MEQNRNTTLLSTKQIFNYVKFSSIYPFGGVKFQKSEILKSTPNTNKEIISLAVEQNKITFFKSQSNPNEFSEAMKNFKDYAKCNFCRKTFDNISDLIIHKKSHTDEKYFLHLPFKCTICPRAFKNIETLKIHLKTHPSKKSFKCNICSKLFLQSDSLQLHTKVKHGML